MDEVARLPSEQRAELFRETGARQNLAPALIEKDFWVCWTLGELFDIPETRDDLIFKGGTSLLKVFGIIKRFSEDIDLAVDYAPLGFVGDRDPAVAEMSRSRRDRLLGEMMTACHGYIAGPFIEAVRVRCDQKIPGSAAWTLSIADDDPNVVEFAYPSAGLQALEYVKPRILLELGTHAELIPSAEYRITPFAAEQFPAVFNDPSVGVKAIKAERTFWEKATILHAERHRPLDRPMPQNYARHYYDMFALGRSEVRDSALDDLELLEQVVDHKLRFYYAAWARYDLAVSGTLALVPAQERLAELRRDYQAMSVMFFDDPPPFGDILAGLETLEANING